MFAVVRLGLRAYADAAVATAAVAADGSCFHCWCCFLLLLLLLRRTGAAAAAAMYLRLQLATPTCSVPESAAS